MSRSSFVAHQHLAQHAASRTSKPNVALGYTAHFRAKPAKAQSTCLACACLMLCSVAAFIFIVL